MGRSLLALSASFVVLANFLKALRLGATLLASDLCLKNLIALM